MDLLHTAHVPAGPGPFPTIIALHGWGASGHDLLGLAPYLLDGEALVLCPQGKIDVPIGPGMKGYGWFPLVPGQPADPAAFLTGAESAREFLAAAEAQYPIDRERVVLLGFSQGGALAYELGLRQPERFAGVAALSTWLPPALASAFEPQDAHRELPVLVIHGTEDPVVPVAKARESRDALERFGMPVTYHEMAMGHEIRQEALNEILSWLRSRLAA